MTVLEVDKGESYFERYYKNGSSPRLRKTKMNIHAFVSIKCMRAGHFSLKASLSRFSIVSMAECECGDGLQTEEHIFWDCKMYDDQRATMMEILPENSNKEYPKSVTEILRIEKKRTVQGICYFIKKIPNFISKKKNVQNINNIFLGLS
jgi:hypothetical protein